MGGGERQVGGGGELQGRRGHHKPLGGSAQQGQRVGDRVKGGGRQVLVQGVRQANGLGGGGQGWVTAGGGGQRGGGPRGGGQREGRVLDPKTLL